MTVSTLSISPAAWSVGQYARASANTLFAAASRPVRMSPQPMKSPDSAMGEHSCLWRSGSVSPLAQCDGRGDRVGTVSYTHLRAHETRHDIVCRLLLEKKKK